MNLPTDGADMVLAMAVGFLKGIVSFVVLYFIGKKLGGNTNWKKVFSVFFHTYVHVVFAVDLYNGKVGTTTDEARQLRISFDQELSKINWPVLGVFVDLDSGIPPETVNQFEFALNEAGIENDITIYPGVNHAFANPSGDRYAPDESKDAWQKTLLFFEQNLN